MAQTSITLFSKHAKFLIQLLINGELFHFDTFLALKAISLHWGIALLSPITFLNRYALNQLCHRGNFLGGNISWCWLLSTTVA